MDTPGTEPAREPHTNDPDRNGDPVQATPEILAPRPDPIADANADPIPERPAEGFPMGLEQDRYLREAAQPADIHTPLRWMDLISLGGFYLLGGAVIFIIVATLAYRVFGISPASLQASGGNRATVLIVSQAVLSAATLAFLYLMVRSRTVAPFWSTVGWRPLHGLESRTTVALQYIFGGVGLALIVGWVSRYLGPDTDLPVEELFRNRQSVLLLTALGVLVAPLVEETIFRGCIYPIFARRFGIRAGIVVTGLLFGLAHAEQLWGGWGQIALLAGVGIVLTYVRARAGTVAASYFVHLGYNSILFVGFYLATGGLRHFPS